MCVSKPCVRASSCNLGRISPTSFYALQTGAATVARVDTLVSGWLQNKSRFAVTADGDPSSNDEL